MDESALKELKRLLVIADVERSIQLRHMLAMGVGHPLIKVYMYKEQNHNLPHVHVYFLNNGEVSMCLKTGNILVGSMNSKLIKVIKKWVLSNQSQLLDCWEQIQMGNAPELKWVDYA